MEPSNGEIDDTQKVESEEEKREVQSVIESSNGELEETQKLELQAEEKKVVVQHVGDVEAVVESVREIVLDGDSKLVDETSDGGDRGLRSSSFDKEETLNEKSSEVVYSGELEEETEVSSSVADSVPVVSLSKDFIQGVEELVENSIGLESKEREEKASLSSDNTEIRISRVESSDENNVSSDALTDVVSKGIEETTFPNLDVPVVVTDVVSPRDYPTSHKPSTNLDRPVPISDKTCPSFFRWIHEDLRHWKGTGITRDMVEGARRTAHFRLVIVDGKAYVEVYRPSIQSRAMFTLWGILQLLRWYPGRLPDLDLMFDCDDRPVVQAKDFHHPNARPPPLFRYCSDGWSLDIVFPDWSFWGWAETNIRPWGGLLEDIKEGNKRTKWMDRVPYAYWRGNPNVAPTRKDLLKCNVSDKDDWNTRLYIQDWVQESKKGYKQSNLENQCTHRYKIYIEGWAWSVSEKYILACDSMTLLITPRYYDFFIRGMAPLHHYWPIRDNTKCTSLKFAVQWGNNHTLKAQAIGKAASKFIQEDLKMDNVYDYMFHLLNEYAKLLKFTPTIPPGAVELCSEIMACPANGTWEKFMVESMVKSPSDSIPCTMPPPYDPSSLQDLIEKSNWSRKQVETWENEYWQSQNNKMKH